MFVNFMSLLGLLSTEAGTIGRVVGDMAITVISALLGSAASSSSATIMNQSASIWNLVNALYAPIGIGVVISILLVNHFSTRLDPEPVTIK